MNDEWQNGYKAGYDAGYEAAYSDIVSFKEQNNKKTKIHDPGVIDEIYEQAYGAALYRKMKSDHDKF